MHSDLEYIFQAIYLLRGSLEYRDGNWFLEYDGGNSYYQASTYRELADIVRGII